MDIQQLVYLVKAIENGSISQTAQELDISQPGVTKGIKKLEAELGAQLIERHGKGIKATVTGDALYKHAKAILNQVKRATDDLELSKGILSENISIGCSPSFVDSSLPMIISAFAKHYPNCKLTVKKALFPELLKGLKSGQLDAILALDFQSHSLTDLHCEVLGQSSIVFVANPAHPLTKLKKLSIKQLHDARWIILEAPDAMSYFQGLFQTAGLQPVTPHVHSESMSLIKSMLLFNDFIGFLPKHMIKSELKAGSLIQLPVDTPVRNMDMILAHNESLYPSEILRAFLQVSSDALKKSS